jgi:hypothetical protein
MRLRSDDESLNLLAVGHDLKEDKEKTHPNLVRAFESLLTENELYTLECLTHRPYEPYKDYIERVCTDKNAILIKMSDLRDNSDIMRLKGIREKDYERIGKYHRSFLRLKEALKQHG